MGGELPELTIDLCMPTLESAQVLDETLDRISESEKNSPVSIGSFILVDGNSQDETLSIARRHARGNDWNFDSVTGDYPLQQARRVAINRVESEWFLFLDDDVRIGEDYLQEMAAAVAPAVGGIQGRKGGGGQNAKWVRWRSHRAGTHATLLRHEAVEDIDFPQDLTVLEDEYIRQHVEEEGFLWSFNHRARFDHENQGRHPGGWSEGYLAGKYGLTSFCFCSRKIPASIANRKNPSPHIQRSVGWICGWVRAT